MKYLLVVFALCVSSATAKNTLTGEWKNSHGRTLQFFVDDSGMGILALGEENRYVAIHVRPRDIQIIKDHLDEMLHEHNN